MLHQGYWLAEFLIVSKILKKAPSKYARSYLLTESDDNDLTYFILYHLEVICRAIDELIDYLKRKSTELRQVRGLIQHDGRYNHRQVDLLSHALKHPDDPYTIQRHMSHHGIVYETGRKDLMELVEAGLLSKERNGKQFVFLSASDLAKRLEEDA